MQQQEEEQRHHHRQHRHHHHHGHNRHKRHHRSYASARAILTRYNFQLPLDFKLGSGRYSKVYKAFNSTDGRYFAIKITDMDNVSDNFRQKFIPRERRVWRSLNHPNTVRLYNDFRKSGYLFEIIDLATGGDMLTYLRNHGSIDEMTCRSWLLQLIAGLSYLHSNRIVHRDLKLENILIFEHGIIKITDYGFCKECEANEMSSTFCGTTAYKAPEVLQITEYDPYKADVWGFGVVAFVMLTDRLPFKDSNRAQMVEDQRNHRYRFPARLGLSSQCRAAIDTILTFYPNERPSIYDVRNLQWFASGAVPHPSVTTNSTASGITNRAHG